ncbi:oligoendopeptidase F [candidate division KSB1 bacterium]|nr:oligoendopeptidase F [candidate division KSB1 bacterium]
MYKRIGAIMFISSLLFLAGSNTQAQTRNRSEIDKKYTWNLTDLYPDDAAYENSKNQLENEISQLVKTKGTLANSANDLQKCLNKYFDIRKEFNRLYSYAGKKYDLDTRVAENLSMRQELQQRLTDFYSKTAFIEPEIIAIDKEKIDQFLSAEPELGIYVFYLHDLQRRKEHMLSEKEEKILAEASLMSNSPYDIYSVFSNAEFPFPEIELSDGSIVKIDLANYALYRASTNREDRQKVFDKFFDAIQNFKNTYGTQLYAEVKSNLFYTRTRGYESCLARALDPNNIPTQVYMTLIKNVNDNLDTFHRYLKLKKRMLGVDTLRYSDIYAPTVKGVDLKFTIDESYKQVLAALTPLGKDYVNIVKEGMENRWIDVYPTTGKRSGAYSSGSAYDVHPYILLNFNGKYGDVSILAHELGHTMHSYLSNKHQPFATSDYSIFVAEVASTFNEALLFHDQLEKVKDDEVRLSMLMNYLDGIKGTVFRQTQFAEFELKIHQKAEKGEALTGQALTDLYADIVRRYYGHDDNICVIDDVYTNEWAYIPHFYYNFYVYQYATSFTASIALSEKVLNGEKGVTEKYLAFLSSGGSDYPINLLKKAGVDMTTSEPFNKTMVAMNRVMDEIEEILKKKGM